MNNDLQELMIEAKNWFTLYELSVSSVIAPSHKDFIQKLEEYLKEKNES